MTGGTDMPAGSGAPGRESSPVGSPRADLPIERTIFVSYASHDSGVAMSLVAELERSGAPCWIAPRDVPSGSDYASEIVGALRGASVVVFLLSQHSSASAHCSRELELAVDAGIPLLPVKLDQSSPSPGIEYRLSTVQWVEFTEESTVAAILHRLHDLGVAVAAGRSAEPASPRTAGFPARRRRQAIAEQPLQPIAGRANERRLIDESLAALGSTGTGRVMLLSGTSGVGKSALADELIHQASSRDFRIARTTCGQFNQSMPFFPLRELTRQLIDTQDIPSHVERIFGPHSMQASMAAIVDSPIADPQARREAIVGTFANVVYGTVNADEGGPIVLFIDDLESVDPGSIDGLLCLLARIDDGPVLIAGAYRSDVVHAPGRSHALSPFLDAATRLGDRSTTVRLGPVPKDDLPAVIESILGGPLRPDARLVDHLWAETEGNALFLREILLAVRAFDPAPAEPAGGRLVLVDGEWRLSGSVDGMMTPRSVDEAISRNLQGLDSTERSYLEFASVIGKQFGFDVALELSGADEDVFLETLERAIGYSIIRELEDPADSFEFSHGKVRDVLYHSLSRLRRKRIHSKVADLIASVGAGSDADRAALIGEHLYLAERYSEAGTYLERSAREHMAVRNARRAAQTYKRVLVCLERSAEPATPSGMPTRPEYRDIELQLVSATILSNDYERARTLATDLIAVADDSLQAGWASDYIGDILQVTGDPTAAIDHYHSAERLAIAHNSPQLLIEVCADLGELHERLAERVAGLDPDAFAHHQRAAEEYLDRQFDLAQESTDPLARARAFRNRAKQVRRRGQLEAAIELYERSIAETDQRVATHQMLISYAKTLRLIGRHDEAVAIVSRVLDWSTQIGARRSQGIALHYRALLTMASAGATDAAFRDIEFALALHQEIGYDRGVWEVRTLCGEWYAAHAMWAEALEQFRLALDHGELTDGATVDAVVSQLRAIDEKQRAQSLRDRFDSRTELRGRTKAGDEE